MKTRVKTEQACPNCGGRSYTWGAVHGHSLGFVPDRASWLKRNFHFGTKIAARLCDDCGNIQLFDRRRPNGADEGRDSDFG